MLFKPFPGKQSKRKAQMYFRTIFLFFILAFVLLSSPILAQGKKVTLDSARALAKKAKLDSLQARLKKDSAWIYRFRKVFPLVAIDQRNSFLWTSRTKNTPVNIWGAKAGVTLFERHNLGIGGYSLENSSSHQRSRDNVTINENLTFKYATAFYEYSFIDIKRWEIGIPIEAGVGQYIMKGTVQNTEEILPTRKGIVFPMGTAIDIYYKPTRWLGINVMGGYRYVLNNTSRLNLSDWFYSVGAAVYIRQIVQDTKFLVKKREYKKEKEKIEQLPD
jgi:hypothetical protein